MFIQWSKCRMLYKQFMVLEWAHMIGMHEDGLSFCEIAVGKRHNATTVCVTEMD